MKFTSCKLHTVWEAVTYAQTKYHTYSDGQALTHKWNTCEVWQNTFTPTKSEKGSYQSLTMKVVHKRKVLILCEEMSQEMVIKDGIVIIIYSNERTQKLLYLRSEYLWYFGCN
jgi:hypothetical protein